MKKIFVNLSIVVFLTGFLTISHTVIAQEPPHPPTSGHGQPGNQNPTNGGAPVGEGLFILLALGLTRAGYKSSVEKKDSE